MWLMAMFDLPVKSKTDRKNYARFRNVLLDEGFDMMQLSVYARFCDSEQTADSFKNRIEKKLPPGGQVRLLAITDKQFGKMEIFHGKKKASAQSKPSQLQLF
ncbi:CRISPR-associated endonuclease Cas2 [Lacunimicrobium album]